MNGEVGLVSPSLLAKINWEKLVLPRFTLGMAEFVDYSSCSTVLVALPQFFDAKKLRVHKLYTVHCF